MYTEGDQNHQIRILAQQSGEKVLTLCETFQCRFLNTLKMNPTIPTTWEPHTKKPSARKMNTRVRNSQIDTEIPVTDVSPIRTWCLGTGKSPILHRFSGGEIYHMITHMCLSVPITTSTFAHRTAMKPLGPENTLKEILQRGCLFDFFYDLTLHTKNMCMCFFTECSSMANGLVLKRWSIRVMCSDPPPSSPGVDAWGTPDDGRGRPSGRGVAATGPNPPLGNIRSKQNTEVIGGGTGIEKAGPYKLALAKFSLGACPRRSLGSGLGYWLCSKP